MQFRDEGYLPEALLELSGASGLVSWRSGNLFYREMVEYFELDDVNVSASTFNMEKLLWLTINIL